MTYELTYYIFYSVESGLHVSLTTEYIQDRDEIAKYFKCDKVSILELNTVAFQGRTCVVYDKEY